MTAKIDETHDIALKSWVASANEDTTDFPIQNLPFGRFKRPGDQEWAIGVAIGDFILDLRKAGVIPRIGMNELMAMSTASRVAMRRALSQGLAVGSPKQKQWSHALVPMDQVELGLPCDIGDYTDFYVGIHHATAVGKLFRPDNPLLPNYKWVPIGYHGRASTIVASGTTFKRPLGQIKPPSADVPALGPTQRLDFEVELGVLVGRPNAMGKPVSLDDAENHVFGLALFNDWSARDFQSWEYQPLGPFLSKNFASTLSPWVVTLEALAPFRKQYVRPPGDPDPLPYLDSTENRRSGAISVLIETRIQTARMRAKGGEGDTLTRSSFAEAAYWTIAQLVAHHTVNGCKLNSGDLMGTGTLSGRAQREAGSLLELTEGGSKSIRLSTGEERRFLEDGDTVEMRARCSRPGFRTIGFGSCSGTVQLDAASLAPTAVAREDDRLTV